MICIDFIINKYYIKLNKRKIMIKQILFLIFTASVINSFAQSEPIHKDGDYKSYYVNGKIKQSGFYKNGKGEGEFKYYFENGKMKAICFVKEDKKEGEWKEYFENGKLAEIGFYKNNKKEGEWKAYYVNGKLSRIVFFKNGDLDDSKEAKLYYDNGNLERTYPQNFTGLCNFYFKNGKIKLSGNFENGNQIGEWKEYYEDGRLKETKIFKRDEKVTENSDVTNDDDEDNKVYMKVEQDAYFPGGDAAWNAFLNSTMKANLRKSNGAPEGDYNVIIRFLVDKNGMVNDVVPETKFGFGMEAEAVRIMKASPKWEPARQNGKKVYSYKKQTISF